MLKMPFEAVSIWLNKLYISIIDPDRSREAFKRTQKFLDPIFLKKVEALSEDVDRLVFVASLMGDINKIKGMLSNAPQDVLDVLVFRFFMTIEDLSLRPGDLYFPDDKPDVLAAFRLFLIEDDSIRNEQSYS